MTFLGPNYLVPSRGSKWFGAGSHYNIFGTNIRPTKVEEEVWGRGRASPGFTWTHADSLGFTWIHLDSLGLTWTHLDSLGLT